MTRSAAIARLWLDRRPQGTGTAARLWLDRRPSGITVPPVPPLVTVVTTPATGLLESRGDQAGYLVPPDWVRYPDGSYGIPQPPPSPVTVAQADSLVEYHQRRQEEEEVLLTVAYLIQNWR